MTLFWATNALVLVSVLLMVLSVYAMIWMPDIYTRLHAASKAGFVGVALLGVALCLTGEPALAGRGFLILVFLILTSPVAAHVVGRAAWLEREEMVAPDSLDESGRLLPNAHGSSEPVSLKDIP